MAYYLGIDIGTTYTAAAVWRDGRYEIASLGNRAPTIPSVVLLRDDESVLTGEAAARRAATEPGRVAREFKRRVGDPTPIIVGGTPYSADALIAKLLRWVVDQVSESEGGPPAGIAVSHPANWGNYKLDLLRQAIRLADLDGVATLSEPEAAAIHYASQARVEPGSVIAVYDLGGGTFDAAVLRKTGDGWQILGSPEGIERLGGVDFDQAVFHHVAQALGGALDGLDPDDPTAHAAVARLRQECVDAKEALSSDSDVSIPVMLPNLQTEVRLTRAEYEGMVRPALADTITAMNRALRSADVTAEEVTAVLLVGGSSRTPLVAELVSSALGRPVAVDAHPKYGVAMGAAITAATSAAAGAPAATGTAGASVDAADSRAGGVSRGIGDAAAGAGAAAVAGGAAAAFLAGGGNDRRAGHGGDVGERGMPASGGPGGEPTRLDPAALRRPAGGSGPADPLTPGAEPPPTRAEPATARHDARPRIDRATPRGERPAPTRGGNPDGRDPRSVTVPYGGDVGADRPGGRAASRPADSPVGAARSRPAAGSSDRDRPPSTRGRAAHGAGPGGGDGGSRGGSGRSPLLVVAALVVIALLVGGALLALPGDDDEDPGGDPVAAAGDAEQQGDGEGAQDPPADTPTTATTQVVPAGKFVTIGDVVLDDGRYRVNYEVTGYEPQVDGGPDSLHIHFFLDTTAPENAGSNGTPAGDWELTDETSSYLTEYTPENRGEATQLCAVVATVDHQVHQRFTPTGNCVPLP